MGISFEIHACQYYTKISQYVPEESRDWKICSYKLKEMYYVKILIIGNSYFLEIHYHSRPKCIFMGYLSISIKFFSFLQYINQCSLSYKVTRFSISE